MFGHNLCLLHYWLLLLQLIALCFEYAHSQDLELFNIKPPFTHFNKFDDISARLGRYGMVLHISMNVYRLCIDSFKTNVFAYTIQQDG